MAGGQEPPDPPPPPSPPEGGGFAPNGAQEQATGAAQPLEELEGAAANHNGLGKPLSSSIAHQKLDPQAEAALDDELLAAAHLGDTDDLDELLRVARLTKSPQNFRDTLGTLLFTSANTGRPSTLEVLFKYGKGKVISAHCFSLVEKKARSKQFSYVRK